MNNTCRPLAAAAFLLLCGQASSARAQVAGAARLAAFPAAPEVGVDGQVMSAASSPMFGATSAHVDSSGGRSSVRKREVVGALIGIATGVVLASFEMKSCSDHSAQSDHEACAIIAVLAVPVIGVAGLIGGVLGSATADRSHPVGP